jgi:hypothetical protein
MSKSIKNYEDLLQEEERLIAQLKGHETLIREDLAGLKEKLKPVGKAVNTASKFFSRDRTNPLATFGIDFSIDLLVRRLLLARAGWFTKILVPFLIKNYSSHVMSEEQRSRFAQKIQSFFDKLRPKKDPAEPKEG